MSYDFEYTDSGIYHSGSPYGGIKNVPGDDIISGLYKWLYEKSDLMALLGHNPGGLPLDPLMFEHHREMGEEGEQSNTLVLKHAGGWSSPNAHNTMKFIRIELEFSCDPIRDELHMEEFDKETIQRIQYIYEQFDSVMHRPAAGIEMWGTVRTLDCTRLGEFAFYRTPGGDGIYRGSVHYGVSVG